MQVYLCKQFTDDIGQILFVLRIKHMFKRHLFDLLPMYMLTNKQNLVSWPSRNPLEHTFW